MFHSETWTGDQTWPAERSRSFQTCVIKGGSSRRNGQKQTMGTRPEVTSPNASRYFFSHSCTVIWKTQAVSSHCLFQVKLLISFRFHAFNLRFHCCNDILKLLTMSMEQNSNVHWRKSISRRFYWSTVWTKTSTKSYQYCSVQHFVSYLVPNSKS